MTRLRWEALTVCAAIVAVFLGGCSLLNAGLPEPVSAEAASAVLDGAQSYFDEMKAQGKDDAAASMSLVAWLRARPEIRSAAVTSDPTIVEFVFGDGTPGLFFGGAAWSESGMESTSGVLEQTPVILARSEPVILARSEPALKEALILHPFPLFFDRSPARVRTALESIGYRITYKREEQADLAALRRIHEYGVVMFSTHGGICSGQVCLLTGERMTDDNWDAYRALRESGKVGVAGHSGQFWPFDQRKWWFVTPAFFEGSPTSQRSLFYAYACYSLGNETMAEALRSSGVAVYYGWRRTVYAWTYVPQRFFRALYDGKTVAEADVADACDDATYVGDGDLVLVYRVFVESRNYLYRISPSPSGSDTLIGVIQTPGGERPDITDIAFDENSGTLWGISFSRLYRIDPLTARATPVGPGLGVSNANALAVDLGGRLFSATTDGSFLTIDTASGRARAVGSYGGSYGSSGDLAFRPDGFLFGTVKAAGRQSDVLIRVNPATGAAVEVGEIGYSDVFGLFFVESRLYGVTAGSELLLIDTDTGRGTFVRKLSFSAWGAQSIELETNPGEMR